MVRPKPSKLAKTKATHNAPGATEALLSTRRSKAKLKMTSTSRANSPIPIQVCLLRSSQRMSFQSMARTCARKIMFAPSDFQVGDHKGPHSTPHHSIDSNKIGKGVATVYNEKENPS